MDERKGAVCTLCGKPLGKAWKKLIVREAEERRHSIQLYTQKDGTSARPARSALRTSWNGAGRQQMFEGILLWFFLIVAAVTAEPGWAIAAGLFAIARYIGILLFAVDEMEDDT